jgi:hypothetical protein
MVLAPGTWYVLFWLWAHRLAAIGSRLGLMRQRSSTPPETQPRDVTGARVIRPLNCMIVGAQKAATTSLLHYLAQHPQICAALSREMTYFHLDARYAQGYAKAFAENFPTCAQDRLLLAKNVSVMYSEDAVERLYRHNPNAQVVMVLRDPVSRAYSAYWYARRMGWEPASSFEEALALESSRHVSDPKRWRNCLYVDRSTYHTHVRRILSRFGRNRVHVLLQEELRSEPGAACQKIFAALRLDSAFHPVTGRRHNAVAMSRSYAVASLLSRKAPLQPLVRTWAPNFVVRNVRRLRARLRELNETGFQPPPLAEETRLVLAELFEPHNRELELLLGRDLGHWC